LGSQSGWWELPTSWREILFFILFITLVIYYKLDKLKSSQPEFFTQFYLLSIALKMLGSLALIFFIAWRDRNSAGGNVILFIITYLTITFLEVLFLLRKTTR
jgi:hypothetical protein